MKAQQTLKQAAELGLEPTLEQTTLASGPIFEAVRHEVALPEGQVGIRDLVYHRGGVCVLALTESQEVVLVRQYRKAAERFMVELPAGKRDPGEAPLDAAKRELAEETGFTAARWTTLGSIYPTPGYCTEQIALFLAQDLTGGQPHPDPGEWVEVLFQPFAKLLTAALQGDLADAKTLVALSRASYLLDIHPLHHPDDKRVGEGDHA